MSTESRHKNIWVLPLVLDGEIQPVTYEVLGEARKLADKLGGEVWCVMTDPASAGLAPDLFRNQADTVLASPGAYPGFFHEEYEAELLKGFVQKYEPEIILAGATVTGRALMGRLASLLGTGLINDCVAFDAEGGPDGLTAKTRPALGGGVVITNTWNQARPRLATIRPRVSQKAQTDESRKGNYIEETIGFGPEGGAAGTARGLKELVRHIKDAAQSVRLTDANFIVAGGRGVKGPEGFELLKRFADKAGATLGATRAAVDAGWIAYPHQIGQTDVSVRPKVYIACGISGQIQHLVGMQSSDFIVAINKDPEAPLMKIADIAIVGDMFEIIPALEEALRKT